MLVFERVYDSTYHGGTLTIACVHDILVEATRIRVAFHETTFGATVCVFQYIGFALSGLLLVFFLVRRHIERN